MLSKATAPFITVSREAGSGGKFIAKTLAQRLGFTLYDEQLVDLIAKNSQRRKRVIAKLDERERTFVDDVVHRLLNPEYVSAQAYFKNLVQVVKALELKGKVVILGRAANFMTSHKHGLHVRVIAPYLVRVGYTMKYEKRSEKDARYRVKKFDRNRKEFARQYFHKDPSNTNYYDLVVSTEQLTIDQVVEAILAAFRQKFPQAAKQ
jgi:cytidylate kinase